MGSRGEGSSKSARSNIAIMAVALIVIELAASAGPVEAVNGVKPRSTPSSAA
jgi:hypothetical protein